LAASAILFQVNSGYLQGTVRNLARTPLPSTPPSFDEVASRVEEMEGVRFRELLATLPTRAPDGDAVLAEIWRLVEAEQSELERDLEGLPPEVLEALRSGDPERFGAALEGLSPEVRPSVMAQLAAMAQRAAFKHTQTAGPDMDRVLREFDPLLRGVAAVALSHDGPRAAIEEVLPHLEEKGWRLSTAVERLWAGERDAHTLTAGVDPNSALLIRRILELIDSATEGAGAPLDQAG
jgi:hypothetical protein